MRSTAFALVVLSLLACGGETHEGSGIVQDVSLEHGQVVVAHDDIPGLMPAMTMNFDVPNRRLLQTLAPGQVIEFELAANGRRYRIVDVEQKGFATPEDGWTRLGDALVRSDPAPPFTLLDQSGQPLSLDDLAGQVVVLDFIYTRCPGPCPILTGILASVQRELPERLRDRVRFASVSLDPLHDTPQVLESYAMARGADLRTWSFLTGGEDEVSALVEGFGVGSIRKPDGEIDHLVISFLIDGHGRIVKRYMGLEHEPSDILKDIEGLAG